jgi:hypothetical protein
MNAQILRKSEIFKADKLSSDCDHCQGRGG